MIATLLILGVVIGANNLAVSLALGAMGQNVRHTRIVAVFGVFEFFMPLAGIWLGRRIAEALSANLSWLAPALLVGFGLSSLVGASFRSVDDEALGRRASSWPGLMLLAASLSTDNLLIGLSLGLGDIAPVILAVVISVFSMTFAYGGLLIGDQVRKRGRRRAEAAAGLLLVVAGLYLANGLIFGGATGHGGG